jgi:hypothetical protein
MNIIALGITSTTVLLAAVIQSAHPADARDLVTEVWVRGE